MEKLNKTFPNFMMAESTNNGVEEIATLHKRRKTELVRHILEEVVGEFNSGKKKIEIVIEMPHEKCPRGAIYSLK